MSNANSHIIKPYLLQLLIYLLIVNIGLTAIAMQLTRDRIDFLYDTTASILGLDYQPSKEVYMPSANGTRRYLLESDQEITFFKGYIALLAFANILLVCVFGLRALYNTKMQT